MRRSYTLDKSTGSSMPVTRRRKHTIKSLWGRDIARTEYMRIIINQASYGYCNVSINRNIIIIHGRVSAALARVYRISGGELRERFMTRGLGTAHYTNTGGRDIKTHYLSDRPTSSFHDFGCPWTPAKCPLASKQ